MFYLKRIIILCMPLVVIACAQSHPETVPDEDKCGASHYQQWLGQPLSGLEFEHFTVPVRAITPTSMATLDFNLRRLNFFTDRTGKISRVYCG